MDIFEISFARLFPLIFMFFSHPGQELCCQIDMSQSGGVTVLGGFRPPPPLGCSEGRVYGHFYTKVTNETPHILLVADPNPISKFIFDPFLYT